MNDSLLFNFCGNLFLWIFVVPIRGVDSFIVTYDSSLFLVSSFLFSESNCSKQWHHNDYMNNDCIYIWDVNTCILVYVHVVVYVHLYIYSCTCSSTCTLTCSSTCTLIYVHVVVHVHLYIYSCTCSSTCTLVYIFMYM